MDVPQEGRDQSETAGNKQTADMTDGSAASSLQLPANVASNNASASATAPAPSTSMLPVQTGPSIHVSSHGRSSLPISSSSSSQSQPPTPSQLLKGKQKEASVPLSPFGQNDMNNSRADKDDSHTTASALKAFVRPEAGDTQIAAATTDAHPPSSLPTQESWPGLPDSLSTTSLDNFSLPSEGLFPSDGSDMADLFGPGSAALFEQIRAGQSFEYLFGPSPDRLTWALISYASFS